MEPDQIAIAERVAEEHRHHKKAQFFWVWGALLVLTAIEVYLTYQNMQPMTMLTILMGLSLIKAALIIGFFMHLRYEVSLMKWLTMCSVVGCFIIMTLFMLWDAHRVVTLGVR
ncbi:MAG TPA: cytochrome C oxidase subunit IV family protein [Candidatus Angelobacter sp.]|nr:cytochrome C oxidase subunit IV family protein [Candidatus Angelobacter sp.]